MARCAYCQTETQLYHNKTPVCVPCADLPPGQRFEKAQLCRDLSKATARAEASTNAFIAITDDIPSAVPRPDGVQRIRNASSEMKAARSGMMKAHHRLSEFLERGIVPDDLK